MAETNQAPWEADATATQPTQTTSAANPWEADTQINGGVETPKPMFSRGDRGDPIREIQQALIDNGITSGGRVDGSFGRNTEIAIQDYQALAGLPQTGVLDNETYQKLVFGAPIQTADTNAIDQALQDAGGQDTFINSFVNEMATREGTTDHMASEGQFTYAYGILPATASNYGIDPNQYSDRRQFAEAVYTKMYDQASSQYSDVFNGLTDEQKVGVLSLYINLGNLPNGVVNALSGDTKDFEAAGNSLASVIHYTNRQTGTKYASKGLAVRRASEYNILRAGDPSFSPITAVSVTGSRQRPVFNWLDSDNNVVISFASSRQLSPDNSLGTIGVN